MPDSAGSALLRSLEELQTPCVVVDHDVVEANIRRFQSFCDAAGLGCRPHVKTHRITEFAHLQIDAGAIGINCQKLGEVEVMADAGIGNILLTYNIVGQPKLTRLRALTERCNLTVTVDDPTVLAGLGKAMNGAPEPLSVLVECDTGAGRCGVQTPEAARELAVKAARTPGIRFRGLMTYPAAGHGKAADDWLARARDRCGIDGLACDVISTGGTPDMWKVGELKTATEYRAGTYVYNDRSLVARGVCGYAECALTVLATVVSRPTSDRAIVDAGSKALTSDLLGLEGFGHVLEYPDAKLYALNEEHGMLDVGACDQRPSVGDLVHIVPNHACVVSNLFDAVHVVRDGRLEGERIVAARGRSQ